MNKKPFAAICIFFIIAIFLAARFPNLLKLTHVFIATSVFVLAAVLFLKFLKISKIFLFLSIISLGALLYLNSNILPPNHISHFLSKDKLKAEITGIIKSPAETRGVYFGKVVSRYIFELESIDNLKISGLALIRIQMEKDYQYGDRLQIKGTIKRPGLPNDTSRLRSLHPSTSSELRSLRSKNISVRAKSRTNFDYKSYLENQNIFAIINASEKNVTLLSHNYKSNPVLRYAYLIREKIKNQFLEKMPLESGAFLRAILLGDRSELPKRLQESFRNSGTMHILPLQCRRKYSFSPESVITL